MCGSCCRVERLTAESAATSSQKVEAIQQLTSQNETLTLTFKVSTDHCVVQSRDYCVVQIVLLLLLMKSVEFDDDVALILSCLLYTSPSPRDS